MRVINDRLLVKLIEQEDQTPSGIYIPANSSKNTHQKAEVVQTGPGAWDKDKDGSFKRRPMAAQVGDVIIISKHSGHEVSVQGEDYILIPEDDILLVL